MFLRTDNPPLALAAFVSSDFFSFGLTRPIAAFKGHCST